MKNLSLCFFALFLFVHSFSLMAVSKDVQIVDSSHYSLFSFSGQLSGIVHYGYTNTSTLDLAQPLSMHDVNARVRYIPKIAYETTLNGHGMFDLEVSANVLANFDFNSAGLNLMNNPALQWSLNGRLWPYRAWVRYKNESLDVQLGLQCFSFGSSRLLRPLMWFDSVDPRDPIGFSEGVWGGLFRYYFKNNSNLWLWALTGNNISRGRLAFENSSLFSPEFGGRFQQFFNVGYAALSAHYRNSVIYPSSLDVLTIYDDDSYSRSGDFRVGLDARVDAVLGITLEASYNRMFKRVLNSTNQLDVNLGIDYTFDVGSGLLLDLEHMVSAYGDSSLNDIKNVTALMVDYSINSDNNFRFIGSYAWDINRWSLFVGWRTKVKRVNFDLNAYWNSDVDLYSSLRRNSYGIYNDIVGVQFAVVFNHAMHKVKNYKNKKHF